MPSALSSPTAESSRSPYRASSSAAATASGVTLQTSCNGFYFPEPPPSSPPQVVENILTLKVVPRKRSNNDNSSGSGSGIPSPTATPITSNAEGSSGYGSHNNVIIYKVKSSSPALFLVKPRYGCLRAVAGEFTEVSVTLKANQLAVKDTKERFAIEWVECCGDQLVTTTTAGTRDVSSLISPDTSLSGLDGASAQVAIAALLHSSVFPYLNADTLVPKDVLQNLLTLSSTAAAATAMESGNETPSRLHKKHMIYFPCHIYNVITKATTMLLGAAGVGGDGDVGVPPDHVLVPDEAQVMFHAYTPSPARSAESRSGRRRELRDHSIASTAPHQVSPDNDGDEGKRDDEMPGDASSIPAASREEATPPTTRIKNDHHPDHSVHHEARQLPQLEHNKTSRSSSRVSGSPVVSPPPPPPIDVGRLQEDLEIEKEAVKELQKEVEMLKELIRSEQEQKRKRRKQKEEVVAEEEKIDEMQRLRQRKGSANENTKGRSGSPASTGAGRISSRVGDAINNSSNIIRIPTPMIVVLVLIAFIIALCFRPQGSKSLAPPWLTTTTVPKM